VTAERELNGYSIVTWVDHVDDSGYFIFLANHASGSEKNCGMYATRSARTLGHSQLSAFAVAPELMLTCMDTNARSKNAYANKPFHLAKSAALNNQTLAEFI
jgi:hypothetical protein